MRLLRSAIFALLVTCTLSIPVPRQDRQQLYDDPQVSLSLRDTTDLRKLSPEVKEDVIKQLETDMVRAAEVGAAAQVVRMEQQFEDEILATAVKKLLSHRGNRAKQAQDMRELRELVRRDKRAVEMLGNVLGSNGGSSSGTGGGNESNAGGSDILGLATSLLGSSSGGGDGEGEGGGGSNILSLLGPLSGSLSGGSSGTGGDGEDAGGGSNFLSLLTGLLGSSSGSSAGGDSQDGGGGSNVLSLLSTVLGGSSGTGETTEAGAGGTGAKKDPLQGGTYDDLIGKGPFSSFGNSFSRMLMFKFTLFRTVFSLVTNLLTSKSSTS